MTAIKEINCLQLKEWLSAGKVTLIDVREPQEYEAKAIEGSVLIPLGEFSLSKLPKKKASKIVLQCRSGCRSAEACARLLAEDPSLEVYNLQGGILAWSEHQFATVEGGKN